MSSKLSPEAARQLAARVNYYREMGIYDFYRRPVTEGAPVVMQEQSAQPEPAQASAAATREPMAAGQEILTEPTMPIIKNKPAALKAIREDIGDCTRCRLHKGRTNIVFGVGNVDAQLMFVGEGPGADEDAQGEPFVGRAGQLLNNMINAMGIKREDVYIANVVKCRPPGNRTPEGDECDTCLPFLLRQIEVIRPKVIVALGATAAKNLLLINDSMGNLRGRWYDFKGARLAVTYHPAYLLRDPRQKAETWKDLQMVMKFLGLTPRSKASDS
ncbi:MAG: uracil-DNA glycosylase [Acidobacteriia bacterium]|nr:uracil-DNA glycosylase [Terriglobia bacterium]